MQQSNFTPTGHITPLDPAYQQWNSRDANLRVKGSPALIIPVASVDELTRALQETVSGHQRLAVRCGGHCLENFVTDPAVEVVIDISMMKGIRFDSEMNAIEIKAGVTLGEMHERLFNEWGIFLPSGEHPAIGIGGHIQGGAFGFFCRQYGLGVDYLYAVEVLWVNKNNMVETIIATCELTDPNFDLWWAHTGGGAGNFGIVSRYWFRCPGTQSKVPDQSLPAAPAVIETVDIQWQWKEITEKDFIQLVSNFGNWCLRNAVWDNKASTLFATLMLWNKATGKIDLKGVLADQAVADEVLQGLLQGLGTGMDLTYTINRKKMNWLEFVLHPFPEIFTDTKAAFKVKDALLLKPFTIEQIKIAYRYLAESDATPAGFMGLATYGSKVNTIASHATASAQRSAIMDMACTAGWSDQADQKKYMDWVRGCYRDLFADTGGVPFPGERTGGCLIPHPDNDLASPELNTSGTGWPELYYQKNYQRLQSIKATWDPTNIFVHTLSVEPVYPVTPLTR